VEGGDDCRKNCRNTAAGAGFLIIISSCCSLPLLALPRVLLQHRPGPVRPWAIIHPLRVFIQWASSSSSQRAKSFANQAASYCLIIMAIPLVAT
jgi:hypothetical protein